MDPNFLLPFIKSTKNIFETMLQLPVQMGEPAVKQSGSSSHDCSGLISFSGDMDGSVILSFPMETAHRTVQIFTGMDLSGSQEDLSDAIGELVNMIAGGAKAQFEGKKISISCPSVIIGNSHAVHGAKDLVTVTIPCSCDAGEFSIEIAVKQGSGSPANAEQANATA